MRAARGPQTHQKTGEKGHHRTCHSRSLNKRQPPRQPREQFPRGGSFRQDRHRSGFPRHLYRRISHRRRLRRLYRQTAVKLRAQRGACRARQPCQARNRLQRPIPRDGARRLGVHLRERERSPAEAFRDGEPQRLRHPVDAIGHSGLRSNSALSRHHAAHTHIPHQHHLAHRRGALREARPLHRAQS